MRKRPLFEGFLLKVNSEQRYRIFFFWISSFLCVFWEILMNEWKSCFFFRCRKKKTALKSNEWMACELGRRQKKTEIHPKISKNQLVFSFFRAFGKKNTTFGFEWMNDQRPSRGKKNTISFAKPKKKKNGKKTGEQKKWENISQKTKLANKQKKTGNGKSAKKLAKV